MSLYRIDFPGSPPGSYQDVWDAMIALWQHKYTDELYEHFLPLFDLGIRDVQRRFDRAIQLFTDILPYDFRASLVRAHRALNTQRVAYINLPNWIAPGENRTLFLNSCFGETLHILRDVARDADRRRQEAVPPIKSAG